MKWSAIKNALAQKPNMQTDKLSTPSVDQKVTKHSSWKVVTLIIVLIAIIIGLFYLARYLTKGNAQPVLPAQELKAIGTFLDNNPPQPLTSTEAATVDKTISQPASLDDSDVQALKDFFNR